MTDQVTIQVGHAVKARREELKLTLRALAAQSGVSASMISDIERGAKSPTVATLAVLAAALRIPLPTLVEPASAAAGRMRVVRSSDRRVIVDSATGARRESFGPAVTGSKVEFLRYIVRPRTVAGPFAAHAPGTIEHVHLAAGALRIVLGDEEVLLNAGDSCSCHADAPHLFDNADGDEDALLYLVSEEG
jgi:transcriptional regulator with XRE-family HTH domain